MSKSKPLQTASNSSKVASISQVTSAQKADQNAQPETTSLLDHHGTKVISSANTKSSLSGIGGWLLLFCVMVTIVEPIYGFSVVVSGAIVSSANSHLFRRFPQLSTVFFIMTVVYLAWSSFSVVVGARIWKKKAGAVKLAQIYLLIRIPLGILLFVLPLIFGLPEHVLSNLFDIKGSTKALIHVFIGSIVWYLYFNKSVRVRNTFPNDF